jgi:hypothetical protein
MMTTAMTVNPKTASSKFTTTFPTKKQPNLPPAAASERPAPSPAAEPAERPAPASAPEPAERPAPSPAAEPAERPAAPDSGKGFAGSSSLSDLQAAEAFMAKNGIGGKCELRLLAEDDPMASAFREAAADRLTGGSPEFLMQKGGFWFLTGDHSRLYYVKVDERYVKDAKEGFFMDAEGSWRNY